MTSELECYAQQGLMILTPSKYSCKLLNKMEILSEYLAEANSPEFVK